MRLRPKNALLLVLILLPLSCSRLRPAPSALDRLKPCANADGPTDAYCGKMDVWEDRVARAGRKIALKIVVLPGLRREPAADPIFFLAGGPGQGAAKMARQIRELFRTLQTDRDIVLVDQRGAGDSRMRSSHWPARRPRRNETLPKKPLRDTDRSENFVLVVVKSRACPTPGYSARLTGHRACPAPT
jgi:pimeloyl-ACP methyl ester carboxylesterase